MLPFTREQFLGVFATYNEAVWPAPVAAYGLALVAVAVALAPRLGSGRWISAILALMWLWTGIGYHYLAFRPINPIAGLFAAAFVVQALLLVYDGVVRGRLRFTATPALHRGVGVALVTYAMILYPLLGWLLGHAYPAVPTFGITPCPLTIYTLGMLLLASRPLPWSLFAIPVLWSPVGGSAALLLGVPQDLMLPVAGLLAAVLAFRSRTLGRARAAEPGNVP